jgi:hypothetical protein
MPFFQTKIRRARVTWSPFTAEQMQGIAQAGLSHIIRRIQSATDATDSAAKPLDTKYAEQKRHGRFVALGGNRRYSGFPVRDWTLRGRTIQSMKVKAASENVATIGPISREAYIIMYSRNRLDHMWGLSPTDQEAIYGRMREELMRRSPLQVTQTGMVA